MRNLLGGLSKQKIFRRPKTVDKTIPYESKFMTMWQILYPFRYLDKELSGFAIAENIRSYSTTYGIVAMLGCSCAIKQWGFYLTSEDKGDRKTILGDRGYTDK